MAKNRKRKFRGVAPPVLVREPLFVRLCASFVDNLTLILRAGLVMGAVLLVHDLRILLDEVTQPVAEFVPALAVPVEIEAIGTTEAQEPVLSEGVMHALNCTYEDYRNAHYDECVEDPSKARMPNVVFLLISKLDGPPSIYLPRRAAENRE